MMVAFAMVCAAVAAWWGVGSPRSPVARLTTCATPRGREAGIGIAADRRLLLGAGLGAALAWLASGAIGWIAWPLGLAVALLAAWGLGRLEPASLARQRQRVSAELPGALDLIRAVVDAGLPLQTAVAAVVHAVEGPLGERLQIVLAQIRLGGSEPEAWRLLADDPVLGSLAQDVARTVATGAGLGDLLQQHADEARENRASTVEQRARAVGVRTVLPLMCCYLPAFLVIGIAPIVAGFVTGFLS